MTMESEDELIPIFRMTKEFCKNAKVAVNYSFSLHAMLNAVIAVQGNMDVTRLGTISGKFEILPYFFIMIKFSSSSQKKVFLLTRFTRRRKRFRWIHAGRPGLLKLI